MKSNCNSYVLMLVYVDSNLMDIGGNIYPVEGYVEANNFTEDIDIRNGLYGILWGKTCSLSYEKIDSDNWIVIKTEISEDLIKTDFYYNYYKFRSGTVVYFGNLRSAAKYIITAIEAIKPIPTASISQGLFLSLSYKARPSYIYPPSEFIIICIFFSTLSCSKSCISLITSQAESLSISSNR